MAGPDSFPIGTSTGRTVAIAMASKASKKVATPTMIRVLTCQDEVGSRSIRATTLSTAPAGAAEPMLIVSSPDDFASLYHVPFACRSAGGWFQARVFGIGLPP